MGVRGQYQIKDFEALHALKVDLQNQTSRQTDLLLGLAETLRTRANKPYADSALQAQRELRMVGGKEREVTVQDLLLAFRSQSRAKLHELNPALEPREIDELFSLTQDFLVHATHRQQLIRVAAQIGKVEEAKGRGGDPQELKVLLDDLALQMQARREYQIGDHPEYLNLEHTLDLMIRGSQADHLYSMQTRAPKGASGQELGAALEAIPGSGKTSILLTLQALTDANGVDLSLVVMPESLMPQMSKELQERLGDTYEQSVEIMQFDRETPMDVDHLQRINDRLDGIIAGRKALLMTDSSVQSLFLKFAEKVVGLIEQRQAQGKTWEEWVVNLMQGEESPDGTLVEIQLYRDILGKLRSSGVVTLDEMDLILDVLKAHHFTIGQPQSVKPEAIAAATDFYMRLALNPHIREKMHFHFLQSGAGAPFDPTLYEKEIQPLLVADILEGKVGADIPEIAEFFHGLSDGNASL